MASVTKFSYERLRNEAEFEEKRSAFKRIKGWCRLRKLTGRKRRRVWIPGLRRFLRRKTRFFSSVRVSWGKALKRLKKSQVHMNDLLAGNYLFMHVSPAPFKCVETPFTAHHLHGLSSRVPIQWDEEIYVMGGFNSHLNDMDLECKVRKLSSHGCYVLFITFGKKEITEPAFKSNFLPKEEVSAKIIADIRLK